MSSKMPLTKQQIGLLAGGLVVAVLLYAWIDGGQEPLHPISQPVALPESAR